MSGAGAGAGAPAAGPATAGSARTPPFRLPGEHFAAALAFLVAGGLGMVWLAPGLAAGAFSDPRVAGVTHLLTLGWISTSILGALYQFLPVALGASIRWEGLADVTFAAWVAGVAAFAGGMILDRNGLAVAGAGAVGGAIVLLLVNLGGTLPRATRRGLTWWCVLGAAVFLAGAWVLGFLLAVNQGHDLLGDSRFVVAAVHLHIAAGGWILLTMIGVADRLLPMFLLSHGAPTWPGRAAAAAVAAGALGLLLSDHVLGLWILRPAGAALAAGTALFLLQALLHYRARRRSLEPGMTLVAGALLLLGAAAVTGWVATGRGLAAPRLLTAYGLLLVPGGLGLFVAGHYYRIVPFLTWFHRFGPVAADRDVPRVGELFGHGTARAAGGLMTLGVAVAAAAAAVGEGGWVRAGATAFSAGSWIMAAQMARIATRRPT